MRLVDAHECERLIDQIRISVPSSIKESERTIAERDRILADAQSQAQHLVGQAQEQATVLMSQEGVIRAAQEEAERIIEESKIMSKDRISEADNYSLQVLHDLAEKLQNIKEQVDNGIQVMQNSRIAESTDEATE